jgi:transposase
VRPGREPGEHGVLCDASTSGAAARPGGRLRRGLWGGAGRPGTPRPPGHRLGELAATPPWAPLVGRLGCLRGVGVLTALGLAVEVGDWQRFTGATIGAYLGLVPTEHSSGLQRVQGSITKTGNSHARRLLVEGAWHHRKPYRPSRELQRRQAGQPAVVRERAERGNHRLYQRWCRLDARGKRSTISVVAVARELAGWCWSLAVLDA